jgi:hypothetical protein
MLFDEPRIEHACLTFPLCFVVRGDNALADTNDRSGVAADFQLIMVAAYAGKGGLPATWRVPRPLTFVGKRKR